MRKTERKVFILESLLLNINILDKYPARIKNKDKKEIKA